jgi:protein-disulfide isomerase
MEGRQQERERRRAERQAAEAQQAGSLARKRRLQYLIIGGFAAVAVIVALIVISQSGGDDDEGGGGTPSNIQGAQQVNAELSGIPQSGAVLGEPSAPVTVIEFGDPQCTACKFFSESVAPDLISSEVQPGNVKYEFRPYLIIGPDSTPAMTAALAAGDQGRFWNYIQLFYANQGGENSGFVTDDFLTSIARGAGVPDIDQWNTDRNDQKWDATIQQGASQAEGFGFSGTPSVVVQGPGGEQVLGGSTIPDLQQIQAAIQQVT